VTIVIVAGEVVVDERRVVAQVVGCVSFLGTEVDVDIVVVVDRMRVQGVVVVVVVAEVYENNNDD
jgi:uncharacterized membrane protein YhiD involved in acid resistance